MTVMKKTVDSPPWKRRNAGEHNHVLGRWSTLQGAERHAKSLASAADPEYRDCSFPGAEREAKLLAAKDSQVIAMPRVLPNPSTRTSRSIKRAVLVWLFGCSPCQAAVGIGC